MAGSDIQVGEEKHNHAVRGRRKSGRVWKEQHARSNAKMNVKPLRSSWKAKMNKKLTNQSIKDFERELKDTDRKAKEEKRLIMEARKKLKEENARKAEIVQVITKSSTLKKMKKKHLKTIRMG
ncbi:Coiled-coil domain-containing protein 86 [Trichoplax sp. H2]|uniref:Coiled-coil domain-containing protein 86 n=1 Tax=Trichoplax adhaerens TaxID=10228 RepID=B3SAM5_TRIAD|nr:hypothetical protein TRIADDRAFT_61312 [Trichoplax adhaerens]EDV20129.1 hypothetical protein TRIADDRAFT_61312 [Trichoplax adhaerens]RDD38071.1 Coiled-coil domain-containing protein 86 [Trichoplax sp. H2]|eukprot:XP_002117290.1 hypothetical protein TRIADDRAFT_61312 [Trichoplax adhaerens]